MPGGYLSTSSRKREISSRSLIRIYSSINWRKFSATWERCWSLVSRVRSPLPSKLRLWKPAKPRRLASPWLSNRTARKSSADPLPTRRAIRQRGAGGFQRRSAIRELIDGGAAAGIARSAQAAIAADVPRRRAWSNVRPAGAADRRPPPGPLLACVRRRDLMGSRRRLFRCRTVPPRVGQGRIIGEALRLARVERRLIGRIQRGALAVADRQIGIGEKRHAEGDQIRLASRDRCIGSLSVVA